MSTPKSVESILPHREPFLFLDDIVALTETTVHARSLLLAEAPHFRGHYPGNPVMPGVLLCETVLQAGAYLMATRLQLDSGMKGVPVVSRMNNVKFKRIAKPGDILEVRAELERSMMGAHFMKGSIHCGDKLIMTLDFAVNLVSEDPAR